MKGRSRIKKPVEGVLSWKEYPGKKRVNRRKSRLEKRKGKLNGSGNSDLQFK